MINLINKNFNFKLKLLINHFCHVYYLKLMHRKRRARTKGLCDLYVISYIFTSVCMYIYIYISLCII